MSTGHFYNIEVFWELGNEIDIMQFGCSTEQVHRLEDATYMGMKWEAISFSETTHILGNKRNTQVVEVVNPDKPLNHKRFIQITKGC